MKISNQIELPDKPSNLDKKKLCYTGMGRQCMSVVELEIYLLVSLFIPVILKDIAGVFKLSGQAVY